MTTWIVLLRGVNVGGHRKVPMAQLRRRLDAEGYERVRTYTQSGNVVLDADAADEAQVVAELSSAVEAEFGFDVAVTARTRTEWSALLTTDPFPGAGPADRHVVFFAEPPDEVVPAGLDPVAFEPERLALIGREVHLFLPDGVGRSKLAVAVDRATGGNGTARNWRSVMALGELAAS